MNKKVMDNRSYSSWRTMKSRCNNPNHDSYYLYGGKGITYDPKWETFKGFLEDMGERPSKDYSIDRIDPNANYCKSNCRWILKSENSRLANTKHGRAGTKEYISEWRIANREKMLATMKVYALKRKNLTKLEVSREQK